MSFRDLKDEIFLILIVKGGHGFGFATNPLVITANLAGNVHESFVAEPGPQPKFENEFVWIMEKTKMKSLWAEKIPVRLECISINQSVRSRIGYVILNLRDAQIIQDETKIVEKEIRLLGLSKDISLLKPELIFSFYITDVPLQKPQLVAEVGEDDRPNDGPVKVTLGTGRDHFLLTISVNAVSNFRQLLPTQSDDVELSLLTFRFDLLGASVTTGAGGGGGPPELRMSITTGWACLRMYLTAAKVTLALGALQLGHASVDLKALMEGEGVQWRRTCPLKRSMCCRSPIVPAEPPLAPLDDPPTVDFTVTLSHERPATRNPRKDSAPKATAIGAGDCPLDLQVPDTPPLGGGSETYRAGSPSPHTQLVLTTTDVRFLPSYSSEMDSSCWLRLEKGDGEGYSTQRQANSLPQSFQLGPPFGQSVALVVGHGDEPIAMATLPLPHRIPETENKMTAELFRSDLCEGKRESIGEVHVTWTSTDLTSAQRPQIVTAEAPQKVAEATKPHTPRIQTCAHTHGAVGDALSPRSRELKITTLVQELEDWAEKQRIMVMEDLKEEEASRLACLQREWEAEVGGQLTEGRRLVGALRDMRDRLAAQQAQLAESQAKVRIYKEELDRVHQSKMQEFKDLSRRMQDEFNHKLALIASDKKLLEVQLERQRNENFELKESLKEIERKGESDRRLVENLTHELSLLKEKLAQEQNSKEFFKTRCRKAEQEIHQLNCERQNQLEAHLKSERSNIEQLVFQQLMVERSDLKQDRQLLQEMKQQLRQQVEPLSSTNSSVNGNTPSLDTKHIPRAT